jgi:hypothetical protein
MHPIAHFRDDYKSCISRRLLPFTDQLAAIECLRVLVARGALDTTQAKDGLKGILGEPSLLALCLGKITDVSNFVVTAFLRERPQIVGQVHVPTASWNLVLQNQLSEPRIPSEIGDRATDLPPGHRDGG